VPLAQTEWQYRPLDQWVEDLRAETCVLPEATDAILA